MQPASQKQPTASESYVGKSVDELIALLMEKDAQLSKLLHEISVLKKMHFGPRSERNRSQLDPKTMLPWPGIQKLLDEVAQRTAQREELAREIAAQKERSDVPAKRKAAGPRSEFPSHLPRKVTRLELPEDQRRAACGAVMRPIGVETTQELERISIPYVHVIERVKYACDEHAEEGVATALGRTPIIEGGLLGPGMLAEMIMDHFGHHLPYARLEKKLAHEGLDLHRSVISRSVLRCGELLEPVFRILKDEVLRSFLVQTDETGVIIRNGPQVGRTKGYMWVYRTQDDQVFYDLRLDRSSDGPAEVLEGYQGFISADAYSGYDFLFRDGSGRIELGCWAHLRRKFKEAADSDAKRFAAIDALIQALFKLEAEAKAMSPPERQSWRDQHVRPVLAEIKDWLDAQSLLVLPKSAMGTAIAYARRHWTAFTNFLRDGRIKDITNNAAERALRAVAVGRKNWMFIGHEDAGRPACVLMSLIQTCRECGVDPAAYLRHVLVRVSEPGSSKDLAKLLPKAWKNAADAEERDRLGRQAILNVIRDLVVR